MDQRGRKSIASVVTLNGVDGSPPRLMPPSSLSDAERKIFAGVVAACDHLRPSDMPLLRRYVEVVAMSDVVAERLRSDVMKGRPSQWLATQERLVKLLISLGRQLRLSPISRSSSDPKTLARSGNGAMSAYEMMRSAMTRNDRDALKLALQMCCAEDQARAYQIASMLEDRDRSWEEVASFAASHCQRTSLALMPWDMPPCDVSEDDDSEGVDAAAVKLLRKMLAAGVSRYAPDPLAALAEAERKGAA
jgi:hypothetical protein